MVDDGLVGEELVGDGVVVDDCFVADGLADDDLVSNGLGGDGLAVEVGEAIVCLAIVENMTGKDRKEEVTVIDRELSLTTEDCGGVEGDGNAPLRG